MEAGNRCKDENLPEEVIRRVVDVTSDINSDILMISGRVPTIVINLILLISIYVKPPDFIRLINVISKSYELMDKVKPQALIVLGDTNSCFPFM